MQLPNETIEQVAKLDAEAGGADMFTSMFAKLDGNVVAVVQRIEYVMRAVSAVQSVMESTLLFVGVRLLVQVAVNCLE
jgi:hypothetical protein